MFVTKRASVDELPQAMDIMRRVYEENPKHWPAGLRVSQFTDGLYLVKDASTMNPVGFVGWQSAWDAGRKVGMYAVGILPEHRRQGFAKRAVARLIEKKAADCDEVRAFVVDTNEPSVNLAKSLDGVELKLEKSAKAMKYIAPALGALGTAVFTDQAVHPEESITSSLNPLGWDKNRKLMGVLNLALGAVGGNQLEKGEIAKGLTAMTLAPGKDLIVRGLGFMDKTDKLVDETSKALSRSPAVAPVTEDESARNQSSVPWLVAGGLGAGALGLGAWYAKKRIDAAKEEADAMRAGRVRVTLPTQQEGDAETVVEMPLDEIAMSKTLKGKLVRDWRRRLVEESKNRTRKRRKRKVVDAEIVKESRLADLAGRLFSGTVTKSAATQAQPAVPSPPMPGNPAQRMTQQRAAAMANQPQTDANPQIMQAQQKSMQAEQQASQEVAQAQQQAAQEVAQAQQQTAQEKMQIEQKYQQQIQQLQSQIETSRLESEKVKVQAEMAQQKARMQQEMAKAQQQAEQQKAKLQQQVEQQKSKLQQQIEQQKSEMQRNKFEAMSALEKHHAGLQSAGAAGEHSLVGDMVKKRLQRVGKKITKYAADYYGDVPVGQAPPMAGPPAPKPVEKDSPNDYLFRNGSVSPGEIPGQINAKTGRTNIPGGVSVVRPGAVQRMNRNSAAAVAAGVLPTSAVYRTSYGTPGDWLFNTFMHQRLATPSFGDRGTRMSYAAMMNAPDKLDMIRGLGVI